MHALYHSLKYIESAECPDFDNKVFDHDNHIISSYNKSKKEYFCIEGYAKPPNVYQYSFAISQLIQSVELLLKLILHKEDNNSIFRGNKGHTITISNAISKFLEKYPDCLSEKQSVFLLSAADIRNSIQHYEFHFTHHESVELSGNLLVIIDLICQKLLNINIVDYFDFNHWSENVDSVGETAKKIMHKSRITQK